MADNFDLQGWMRENRQGPFSGFSSKKETFKSSKPKSKTGLNESLMGMIDLQPVGGVMMEDMMDEPERVFLSDKDSTGASFHGHMITCSPKFLKELIGEPQYSKNDGTGDFNYMWTCETDGGEVFVISDDNKGTPLNDDQQVEWLIGAKNGRIAGKAKRAIQSNMDLNEEMDDEPQRIFLSDKDPYGTSFYGQTIKCSVDFLKDLIGEPQDSSNTGRDKTNYEWTCETEEGDVFTIYDWKQGRPIENNEEIEWHIGAKNGRIAGEAKRAIESNMGLSEYSMNEASGMDIADKWDKIPVSEKEEMLDKADEAGEGLADYAYMGWAMVPSEVKEKITDEVMAAKVEEPEPDEDEKMAAMAMRKARSGKKGMKGVTADWSIDDILDGDDDDF